MATKMVLPILGQTMEEGTIIKWLKNEGDQVAKGDPIVEVMTDKVNMEVEASESGVLRKLLVKEDDVVPVMGPIAIIGTADESIDDLLSDGDSGNGAAQAAEPAVLQAVTSAPTVAESAPTVSGSKVFVSPRARKMARENGVTIDALAGAGSGPLGRVIEKDVAAFIAAAQTVATGEDVAIATPLAARIAADQGVNLTSVTGTGNRGRITSGDVLQAAAVEPVFPAGEVKVIPFTGMRKMVADNVAKSAQTAPHVTLTAEVDMTEAVKVRGQIVEQFERKYGTKLSFTDMIVKAASLALLDHPIVNSTLTAKEIRISGDVNIGVAVALDGGLIVPVVKNADQKFVPQISVELKGLIEKARVGNLATAEITGGTFTITNLGAFGIDVFNPIITPGQSAILGVCRIADKPVVVDGQVVVRSMMNLCLSFDHRVMDGAPAAQFLKKIKDLLESPYQLLI